ncbi:hypothetical protein Ae406Ps2_6089 [Pseudonocardia sp. Ae406_Ps2]|nr:hypothetical protein Ae331Ps2_6083c [Pseudonocardia sp. Ae331_Ps2]OLL96253.1 hypothetical protein Ae406Ps2_6089 [Pseudonocardia sp. Ae406_Ps2]OLM08632.1 hypothetical protein Ae505Ps2_6019 [Pseudonocardia sp. Ae505_Ps2]OLM09706.1 hypothetical protein Ae706Ps2_6168c [Pseudonocardia sp. Ae706_Ps2]
MKTGTTDVAFVTPTSPSSLDHQESLPAHARTHPFRAPRQEQSRDTDEGLDYE